MLHGGALSSVGAGFVVGSHEAACVDVMAHYVRERMRAGDLHYTCVSTNENVADCMTKNNYYPAFKKFRAAMGVA